MAITIESILTFIRSFQAEPDFFIVFGLAVIGVFTILIMIVKSVFGSTRKSRNQKQEQIQETPMEITGLGKLEIKEWNEGSL